MISPTEHDKSFVVQSPNNKVFPVDKEYPNVFDLSILALPAIVG